MKVLKLPLLLSLFLMILFASCQKDTIETSSELLTMESISGYVLLEDTTPQEDLAVLLFEVGTDSTTLVATVYTDENGYYIFDQITPEIPGLFLTIRAPEHIISSGDFEPDGDAGEEVDNTDTINVYLENNEQDTGNNFILAEQIIPPCSTSISGGVYMDMGGTLIPVWDQVVTLVERDQNNAPTNNILGITTTDEVGYYFFNLDAAVDAVIILETNPWPFPGNLTFTAIDESPDDDPTGATQQNHLVADVDSCEIDQHNIFYATNGAPPSSVSISGQILLDSDFDGIGNTPYSDNGTLRIELYHRSTDNLPQTPFLDASYENTNGEFAFEDIEPGEYILYFIGNGNPGVTLISGEDLDQEPGEPASSQSQFIPVNLTIGEETDSLNTFVVQAAASTLMPEVVEYWALCDTNIICELTEWPIFVIDENNNPLLTPDGYSIVWTNLNTQQSQTSEWIWANDFETYQATITAPDGSVYNVDYARDCPQDLHGRFYLQSLMGGLLPGLEFEDGDVIWDFDAFNQSVTISHNLSIIDPNLIPEGDYSTHFTHDGSSYSLSVTSMASGINYPLGDLSHDNARVFMDDDVILDGILRTFMKEN